MTTGPDRASLKTVCTGWQDNIKTVVVGITRDPSAIIRRRRDVLSCKNPSFFLKWCPEPNGSFYSWTVYGIRQRAPASREFLLAILSR